MNSSTQHLANIILDCSVIVLSSISLCISILIFSFITYHLFKKRNSPHQIVLLLTANVYLSLFIFCLLLIEQYIRAFLGQFYSLLSLNDGIYCQIRAYFLWVSYSGIYYSNGLQSIYRLCRVVFYTKRSLQSVQLYKILIVVQWILCLLIMIPALLLHEFKYSNDSYYCLITYTDIRSTTVNGLLAYTIPIYTSTGCYIYTFRQIRTNNNSLVQTMTQIQQMNARRDLTVLFRISLILALLTTSVTPTAVAVFIYIFQGFLPWWSYQIQWFVSSLSVTGVTIALLLISPHLHNLWTKNRPRHNRIVFSFHNARNN